MTIIRQRPKVTDIKYVTKVLKMGRAHDPNEKQYEDD